MMAARLIDLPPGYPGSQDSCYIGNVKGIGHIYIQTLIDTYTKKAFAKIYDRKHAIIAADLLNDCVVPPHYDGPASRSRT